MATTKQVRVNPAGRIVASDRQVRVMQDDGDGAADQVEFRYVGNPRTGYTIDFSPYLNGSPFDAPDAVTFAIPLGGTALRRVSRDKKPGVYKYDVLRTEDGALTDDPDVIID
jgi:hypothetical protein